MSIIQSKLAEGQRSAVTASEYTIGATDVLQISVWEQEQLSGIMPVRPDGKITMPLLGDIQAAGFTPMALSNEITQKLGKFIKNGAQPSRVLDPNYRAVGECFFKRTRWFDS